MTYHATPAGAGYIVPVSAPFSSLSYHFDNWEWYEDTDNATRRTEVWVGSVAAPGGGDTQQGVVIVSVVMLTTQSNQTMLKQVDLKDYLTPCPVGSVRIVGAVGERLRLRSTSGATFYFDVPTRQYIGAPTCTPTPTRTPSQTALWTFSGDVTTSGLAPAQPVPDATLSLYRSTGLDWQEVGSATSGSDGQFTVSYTGPSDPAWFLLLVRYPSGYGPGSAQAGPDLLVVSDLMVMSVEPLPAGSYSGNHFFSLWLPDATPVPGTPTPPPLPTVPLRTTPSPSPTIISPLPTPVLTPGS